MSQGLAALRQRKKELLLESDINRQILRVEVCQLQIKATEWRQNLLKIRNAYKWIAPLAGVGFGIYSVRKKLHRATGAKRNGRAKGKSDYLKLLAPIGFAALRKAYSFWRDARKRNGHAANGAT
jgi:hypothetical protein